jgi:hypothetical protein
MAMHSTFSRTGPAIGAPGAGTEKCVRRFSNAKPPCALRAGNGETDRYILNSKAVGDNALAFPKNKKNEIA